MTWDLGNPEKRDYDKNQKAVLIGYKPYSELLVKSIKEMINSTYKLDTGSDIIKTIIGY